MGGIKCQNRFRRKGRETSLMFIYVVCVCVCAPARTNWAGETRCVNYYHLNGEMSKDLPRFLCRCPLPCVETAFPNISVRLLTELIPTSKRSYHNTFANCTTSNLKRNSSHDRMCWIGIIRSRKIESDRDYQKSKERIQVLKVLWKKERLHSKINKYSVTFDINTITSVYFTNSRF